jgi:hypothetical protein
MTLIEDAGAFPYYFLHFRQPNYNQLFKERRLAESSSLFQQIKQIRRQQQQQRELHATPVKSSTTDYASSPDDQEETELYKAYEKWRQEYNKGVFDEVRYQNFKNNYIKLQVTNNAELKHARETGQPDPVPMSLNEYGDYSSEEYKQIIAQQQQQQQQQQNNNVVGVGGSPKVSSYSTSAMASAFSSQSPEEQNRIQQTYEQWCRTSGKTYDESRLDIFAFNLKVVENYYKETGTKAELNKFADLSPEEYKAAMEAMRNNNNVNAVEGRQNSSPVQTTTAASQDPINNNIPPQKKFFSQQGSYLENLSASNNGQNNGQISQTPVSLSSPPPSSFDDTELDRIRNAYMEWCQEYGREYQESRLDIFATNLKAVEKYRQETGKIVKLNQYADLSPDEYKTAATEPQTPPMTNFQPYPSNNNGNNPRGVRAGTSTSYLDNLSTNQQTMGNGLSSSTTTPGKSYLDNLSLTSTPQIEDRVRTIYEDWCQYYGKVPSEDRLQIFAANLVVIEKHHIETGEELTLNEFADQTEGGRSSQRANSVDEEEQKRRIEEERKYEEAVRLEQERRQAEEKARIEEEQLRLEEERLRLEQQVQEAEAARLLEEQKYVEEKARLQREQEEQEARLAEQRRLDEEATRQAELERQRLQEERELLEAKLKKEQKLEEEARMKYEETNRQLDEALKNNEKVQSMDSGDKQEEEEEEVSDPIIVPQSSYMSAVARTWVERSAYLDSLQQGKTKGVLPEPPTEPLERVTMPKRRPKQPPAFLVNSIWKFINDGKQSATDLYARNLIKQADEMIAVSVHKRKVLIMHCDFINSFFI